jgi:hypothetical protein
MHTSAVCTKNIHVRMTYEKPLREHIPRTISKGLEDTVQHSKRNQPLHSDHDSLKNEAPFEALYPPPPAATDR